MSADDFTTMPDLASRALAGSVVYANDELFAERENLINPGPAQFDPNRFGHKGKVYDGWETRRRREPGSDSAIVRLGVPGVVHGVVVDTSWFTGNYPPQVSVEATSVGGYPSPEELLEADWTTLVPRASVKGDSQNRFDVSDPHRFTHLRLSIHPDGGVARFRVHGEPVADPELMSGTIDLAAAENGGVVVDCSDVFYSSPSNIVLPGRAARMGDGWENARRRDDGNDHVTVRLAAPGSIRRVEIDTSYFVGNAPGWASLSGIDTRVNALGDAGGWVEILPRTRMQPDIRHQFVVPEASPVTHLRLDVFPDGGLARLRVHGEIDSAAWDAVRARYRELLPRGHWQA